MQAAPDKAPVLPRKTKSKGHRNTLSLSVDSLDASDLADPRLYLDRELSLLAFQRRVLEEAMDADNPLLERTKFLSILASNLDEFFMVRVAVLKQKLATGGREITADGHRPLSEQLEAIRADVTRLMEEAYQCLREHLLPALEEAGIVLMQYSSLSRTERAALESYFEETVFPVLTPLAFDPGRPFPHISNLSLNIAVVVRDAEGAWNILRA